MGVKYEDKVYHSIGHRIKMYLPYCTINNLVLTLFDGHERSTVVENRLGSLKV